MHAVVTLILFLFLIQAQKHFVASDIFIKAATIVNKNLRYSKNFGINAFFTDCFVSKKKGME